MTTAATGGARSRTRPRLTRERVLRAALDYADAHGLAALSMHKLGAELGVKGMSLYSYVASKDALLDGIVEAMLAELAPPAAGQMSWQDALRGYARAVRDVIRRHPAVSPLLAGRAVVPASFLQVLDAWVRAMISGGCREDQAVALLRAVLVYAQGYALAEVSWATSQALPGPEEDDLHRFRRVAALVPGSVPDSLFALAISLCGECDMDAQFEFGLGLMVTGAEQSLTGHVSPPGPAAS
ncbi:MAG TPA: TetR/AcrR family transcriptional regulator C-terminal domain-containing protein [Streptosporangiaceae bacterium]|jgi:AcrR family transcriptional regulator